MEILIGRRVEGDSAIKVDNPVVSSTHCRVWKDDQTGVYYIEDVGSLNGTTVNGVTIKRMPINANDKIQLGGKGGYETTLQELLSQPLRERTLREEIMIYMKLLFGLILPQTIWKKQCRSIWRQRF